MDVDGLSESLQDCFHNISEVMQVPYSSILLCKLHAGCQNTDCLATKYEQLHLHASACMHVLPMILRVRQAAEMKLGRMDMPSFLPNSCRQAVHERLGWSYVSQQVAAHLGVGWTARGGS